MKIVEKKDNNLVFIEKIEDSLANAIRRYVNQVPTLAVDEVEISKNDSPLYDEIVAHRVGLIPLKSNGDKTPNVTLSIAQEGMALAKGIKGADVVYGDIPITFLNKGEELELKGTTKLGIGADHSKFSPGIMFYRNVADIILDKSLKEDVEKVFPDVEIKEKGDKIIITDDGSKEIAGVCEGICKRNGKSIEIKFSDELVLTVESFGQMPSDEIFKDSIKVLKKDLQEIAKKLKK